MNEPQKAIDALLKIVHEVYENLPFNRLLGLNVANLKLDEAGFSFAMRTELIGNAVHGILHGGVISAHYQNLIWDLCLPSNHHP